MSYRFVVWLEGEGSAQCSCNKSWLKQDFYCNPYCPGLLASACKRQHVWGLRSMHFALWKERWMSCCSDNVIIETPTCSRRGPMFETIGGDLSHPMQAYGVPVWSFLFDWAFYQSMISFAFWGSTHEASRLGRNHQRDFQGKYLFIYVVHVSYRFVVWLEGEGSAQCSCNKSWLKQDFLLQSILSRATSQCMQAPARLGP